MINCVDYNDDADYDCLKKDMIMVMTSMKPR